MSNPNSLSPDEARCLRRRWAAAVVAMTAVGAADVAACVEFCFDGRLTWIAWFILGVILCFAIHHRAARCPRCRGSVFGSDEFEEWTRQHSGWVFILPRRCRTCGARLTAAGSADRAAEGSGSDAGSFGRTSRCT